MSEKETKQEEIKLPESKYAFRTMEALKRSQDILPLLEEYIRTEKDELYQIIEKSESRLILIFRHEL